MSDFQRDYALEAQDDTARFDIGNDIESYWAAHREIEQGWEDQAQRYQLFQKHGIRNEQHFHQVQETVNRFLAGVRIENAIAAQRNDVYGELCREMSIETQAQVERLRQTAYRYAPQPQQRQRFGWDLGDITQMQMNVYQKVAMAQMQQRAQGALSGELAPVEGVSLEAWAGIQAKVASGQDPNALIAGLNVDRATWDRVSAEWMARMSRDTTATIATAYGNAFTQSAQGQFGGAAADPSKPPITLEQWIEIQEAQSAAASQGGDANAVLAQYGMNALAWSNAGGWWAQHFSQNAMKNGGELHRRYSELQTFYQQKFAQASADGDVRF